MTEPRRRAPARRSVRGRGTGSVTAYPTKAGTRWRFQMNVPVDAARPEIAECKHSRADFTSFEAADAELTLLRADLMRNVPQPRGRDTFAACGQCWLDGHAVGNETRMYIQRVLDAMDRYIGSVPMPTSVPPILRPPTSASRTAQNKCHHRSGDERGSPPPPLLATPTYRTPSSWRPWTKGSSPETRARQRSGSSRSSFGTSNNSSTSATRPSPTTNPGQGPGSS